MKKLLKYILLVVLAFVVIDKLAGLALNYVNNHTIKGDYGRNNFIANEMKADAVFFGSSRCIHHYDPRILADSMGMTCYNAGDDGMGIILFYPRYKMIQARYNPKVVVYDVEPTFDLLDKEDNSKYLGFLRLSPRNAATDSVIYAVSPVERLFMLSDLYRYNSKFLNIIAQYKSSETQTARDYTYSPLKKTLAFEPGPEPDWQLHPDSLKLFYLEKLINECKAHGTKLIFCTSPVYKETSEAYLAEAKRLSQKYQIPLLNHYCDTAYTLHRDLFADRIHLNEKGAQKYSKMIAGEIAAALKAMP